MPFKLGYNETCLRRQLIWPQTERAALPDIRLVPSGVKAFVIRGHGRIESVPYMNWLRTRVGSMYVDYPAPKKNSFLTVPDGCLIPG